MDPSNVVALREFLGYAQLMLKLGIVEGNPATLVTFQCQRTLLWRGFNMSYRGFF